MEDRQIVDLYWQRDPQAIEETARKYGGYCYTIAYGILRNRQDSEECVNDCYLNLWQAMPVHRPNCLSAFAGKVARNLSLHRWEKSRAKKRGAGQIPLALAELEPCLPAADQTEQMVDSLALTQALNRFLASLDREKRQIFLRRYWYLCSIREIARDCVIGESKVKMTLSRTRAALRDFLQQEGIL